MSAFGDLYGAERSLLEVVDVLSPVWKPRFVIPSTGPFSAALECAKYPFDVVRFDNDWLAQLTRIIGTHRADLLHANTVTAAPLVAAASRITDVPYVVHLRTTFPEKFPDKRDELWRRTLRDASGIIFISRAVHDSAWTAGVLSPEHRDRIWLIPSARRLSKYRHGDRARIRAELGITDDAPLIGMVGRLNPSKGQHIFLRAAALLAKHLPSARFVLVGDLGELMKDRLQTYRDLLKRWCEEPPLKDRVTFFGYRTDIPDILSALDCFVHPSPRGAFESVLIEAMAMGVPLVVSSAEGIPECVGRDGAAEIINSLEPADYANAIVRIIRDRERHASMSQAGRERANLYEAVPLARQTESAFEAACLRLN